jgi:hypothetical protein
MKTDNENPYIGSKCPYIIFLFIILPGLLIGCNFPTTNNTIHPDRSQSLTQYSTPYVNIQFNLISPQLLSQDEQVNIVILDEVSGLPYIQQKYEMELSEEGIYTTTLSIPLFSVIKYRYEKIGEQAIPEKTIDGRNVRYRMYLVENSGIVNDHLSTWNGDNISYEMGRFEAVVIDQETGSPIPDILVSVGGQLSVTDANGLVNFNGLTPGTHNVVFYELNGKYQSFQQGAVISQGKRTLAEVKLAPNKAVEVTFIVTPPNDAAGAPVYLAGNLAQFGNTFTDLQGSMNIDPKRMFVLLPRNDGQLIGKVSLYEGTDFRFKFTLGDGYWNAELNPDSESITRQLIVPDHDVTLELSIASWRAPVFEPIAFKTFIHSDLGYPGERYIQFKNDQWTEPIPLWPLGNGEYLYILYSPFEITTPITYRVCVTKLCGPENSSLYVSPVEQVEPTDQPLTRTITVDHWLSPSPKNKEETITKAVFPYKSSTFNTIIELSPEISPGWFSSMPIALEEINLLNSEVLLISPQWTQNGISGYLQPEIGLTPFSYELMNYISQAKSQNLKIGLFPQISPISKTTKSLDWKNQNDAWQKEWLYSYRQFILNYAKIAEISDAENLIIGGKIILSALPDENPTFRQDELDKYWRSLIMEIRDQFQGSLLWATNAGTKMDPLPSFIDLFDEIYITVDSPLASGSNPSFEEIAYGFSATIDNHLYEVYRSTFKPITIAFAYPSVEGSSLGCQLIDDDCNNDGLFTPGELAEYNVDADLQALIYNAIFPVAASREWITGISIRGFMPLCDPNDPSSSIACKPAQDVVEYWYTGLNND